MEKKNNNDSLCTNINIVRKLKTAIIIAVIIYISVFSLSIIIVIQIYVFEFNLSLIEENNRIL